MKLIELINYFRDGGSFEKFCKKYSLNADAEVIEVYMTKPFSLDKDLAFFEIEKTKGLIKYISNDTTFYNLFDFYYFLDVIEDLKKEKNKKLSNYEIAKNILSYAIRDA
jgi:hypothetical protein